MKQTDVQYYIIMIYNESGKRIYKQKLDAEFMIDVWLSNFRKVYKDGKFKYKVYRCYLSIREDKVLINEGKSPLIEVKL